VSLSLFQSFLRAATAEAFMHFIVLMSIMGVGISFTWPALLALSVEIIPPRQRGAASSLFNGMRFLGYAVAPTMFTPIYLNAGLDAALLLSSLMLGLVIVMVHVATGSQAKPVGETEDRSKHTPQ
ncbi:MAG: MFS transporter, partial [Candidatus Jordarchaeales archaeon]